MVVEKVLFRGVDNMAKSRLLFLYSALISNQIVDAGSSERTGAHVPTSPTANGARPRSAYAALPLALYKCRGSERPVESSVYAAKPLSDSLIPGPDNTGQTVRIEEA